ncbi:hypothetical protein [Ruminococcus flavefaciens]|uniref:Dockerin domain-containing protein n=1 Tax=Ruminococcus flavefaciens TaxID=1265 RepID=A0A1M7M907_RUMFL|nr:hypothetical protein [Ruminococcus flavefaciens]SHM87260.1 hypothetical protein SAMN04487860_1205 [Ruminococcus flavefaciens]
MRDYDDVTETVLRRRDEMIARDRRRSMILKRSAVAALSVCAAAAIAVFCRRMDDNDFSDKNIVTISETTSASDSNNVITTTSSDNKKVNGTTAVTGTKSGISTETVKPSGTGSAVITTASTSVHTTKNNSVAAAITTLKAQTTENPAAIVTTSVYYPERSTYMKKLMPFAASLVMMANTATAMPVAAENESISGNISYDEFSIFSEFDNGNIDIDIDMDGKFTIKDCYDILAYYYKNELPQAEEENILANADYDGNGKIEHSDCELPLKYFINKNMVRKEHLDPSYYADFDLISYEQGEPIYGSADQEAYDELNSENFDKGAYTPEEFEDLVRRADEQTIIGYENAEFKFSDIFLSYLRTFMNDLKGSYGILCSCVENGDINLDINADGNITFDDIFIYKCFLDQKWNKDKIERNHAWIDSLLPIDTDPEGLLALRDPDFVTDITDEQWAICEADYDCFTNVMKLNDMEMYAIRYLIERDGKPEDKYFDDDYYKSILPGSGKQHFGEMVSGFYDNLCPVDEKMTLDESELYLYLNDYCNAVVAKEIEIPDATGDGVVDYKDVLISDMYLYDYKHGVSREESYIPENVWDFFETQLDLNHNGVCGDICDVSIYQVGVYASFDITAEKNPIPYEDHEDYLGFMKEYRNELKAAKEAKEAEAQAAPAVISGDANCDSGVDLSDAVTIMQSMANPNKYPMSPAARLNADVYKPGSGVTVEDALEIQRGLLNGKY